MKQELMSNRKWTKTFKSFQILVPASISNLGCGFDTLGLAVSLYFKTSVHSAADFNLQISCNGKTLEIQEDENVFLKVLRNCYPVSPDDWHFNIQIETEVPPRKGLGSSACAVISAILTAAKLQNLRQDPIQVLHTAMQWESHPDNICASVYGGFTVAMLDETKAIFCQNVPFPQSLRILLLVPEWEIKTEEARKLLPETYPLQTVVGNLQRLAFFMACMQDGNFAGLRESVKDQVHQPYRAALMPFARDLLDSARFSSDSAVVISGSGPSFAVLYKGHEKSIRSAIQEIMSIHHIGYDMKDVVVDEEGARIESLED
jgi:homoserine kinase